MDPFHVVTLLKARPVLVEDLDVASLLVHLFANFFISQADFAKLQAIAVRREQARLLLDTLPHKGPEAFAAFAEFLELKQAYLHEVITKTLENTTEGEASGAENVIVSWADHCHILLPLIF